MGKRFLVLVAALTAFLVAFAGPASAATASDLKVTRASATFTDPILIGDEGRVVGVATNAGPDTVADFSIRYLGIVNLDVERVRCVGISGVEFSNPDPGQPGTPSGHVCNFGTAEPGARAKMILHVTTTETDPNRFFVRARFCVSGSDNVDPDTSNDCKTYRQTTGVV
jgi:hypothetical protein